MTRTYRFLSALVFSFALFLAGCNRPNDQKAGSFIATQDAEKVMNEIIRIQTLSTPTEVPTLTLTPTEVVLPTSTPEVTATWTMHEKGKADVLILYYPKDIATDRNDDPYYQWEAANLWVPAIEFEQQVRILSELKYTSISLSQLINVLKSGGELPDRPVMFTFDSTEMGMYTNAYPILKKYGFAGNMFVTSTHINAKNSLSLDQIKEMMAAGWEIGCAGYDGSSIADGSVYLNQEIGKCKTEVSKLIGQDVIAFAYPGGSGGDQSASKVVSFGYLAAFGASTNYSLSLDNIYLLPRYKIQRGFSYGDFFNILPWQSGNVSQNTMEWTISTPTTSAAVSTNP